MKKESTLTTERRRRPLKRRASGTHAKTHTR